ncbi:hypothetical protein AUL39_03465 [Tractidigestivibacter scatoligenes]|uniref:Uncharacterized protein n=1 Tax=Tractidigestivibacter scatoligenes TaxID=1299998 RepID=A0A100YXA0_TRASO|nr:DEAD/DEAH box helicase [Tractidigestivibacter scatoligenes]KUH59389.1 hypothetical protein AUL39_03465 [Tractidigestivibacter scatoligenes]
MALTHQEAQQIVARAKGWLDDLRTVTGPEADLATVTSAVDEYRNKTASVFITSGPSESLREGLRRYGRDGLNELVTDSIRLHLTPDISQPLVQDMLVKVDRYLRVKDIAASSNSIAPFTENLSNLVDETASGMRAGWWVFPTRTRKHLYESCEKIQRRLESDAGVLLGRLSSDCQGLNRFDWKRAQQDLAARPQEFSEVLQQIAPRLLEDESGIAGLSDSQASHAESLVSQTDELLEKVKGTRAIAPDIQEVCYAVDAYLDSWTDGITKGTTSKAYEELSKLYKPAQLRDSTRELLKIGPKSINATSSMRQLIIAADKYRLRMRVAEGLPAKSVADDTLATLRARAAKVKQGLPWLLLSDDEKEDALTASNDLARFLNSDDAAALRSACDDAAKAERLDWDAAEQDMLGSSREIVSVLREAAPEAIADESSVGGLTERMGLYAAKAVEDVDSILGEVKKAKAVEPDPQPVDAAVDAYKREKAKDSVANAPIEVINQGSRQFQLRGLKEAGYTTVGSVLNVSGYVLENIPGMGRGVAYEAKQMARDYAEYQQKSARVQLSLDDTSPAMDGLLAAVATYRAMSSAQKRIGAAGPIINKIAQLRNKVEELKPDLVWVVMTPEDRQDHIDAGKELADYLGGPETEPLWDAVHFALEVGSVDVEQAREDFSHDPVGFVSTLEELVPDAMGGDNGAYGLSDELAEKASAVEFSSVGIKVTLRPYQVWGVKFALAQKRVLLGDEMGLGKTIQALAVMVALHAIGYRKFMVVCPLSVLENWCREIAAKSDLSPVKIYGRDWEDQYRLWQRGYQKVAVTTYETLARLKTDLIDIDFLVVDEAHYAKNPEAKRTKNLMRFVDISDYVLFMTGTALENKAQEMVWLISMLQPEVAEEAAPLVGRPFGDSYRNAIAPVYYRRKREDVLDELPELTENEEWCELSADEIPAYVEALRQSFMSARRVSWNVGDLSKSGKARRLKEIVELAKDDGRKVLIFSYFRQTLTDVAKFLGPDHCIGPINGSIRPQERQRMVDRFEDEPAGTVLVAQIQAGGTGLNIQAASVVILCEPQFKPSIENQAISRAYRMGQTRKVFVHRLLCANTIDERIMKILADKQRIFDTFADRSVAAEQIDQTITKQTMEEIVREELKKYGGEQ